MPFSIYIIYSSKLDKYYVGYTENITLRLTQHNEGISTFTSKASDWVLRYTEEYENREAAHQRELEIKRKKSRKYIEWLISWRSIVNILNGLHQCIVGQVFFLSALVGG